jgi:hypothetical protein
VAVPLPRVRQAVVAAAELDPVVERLRGELGLAEPFRDRAVGAFGLSNAVFALGDTFLEVVSPITPEASAARLLERRGGDCGYMVMFQVRDLAAARVRVAAAGVREVFTVELEDMAEVHLHPADMQAAIVSLSQPRPPAAWRWGGEGWRRRGAAVPGRVSGVRLRVREPARVAARWADVVGGLPGVEFVAGEADPALAEIRLEGFGRRPQLELGQVRLTFAGR